MNRYQNPELFERLALSYAVGTLQGKARQRFETLMEQHFYLKATTQAYQHKLAGLVELLPSETPPPEVWQRIEQELKLKPTKVNLWQRLREWWSWSIILPMALASTVLVFSGILIGKSNTEPNGYLAVMKSLDNSGLLAVATVEPHQMVIEVAQPMMVHPNKTPVLWCLHKDTKGNHIIVAITLDPHSTTTIVPVTPEMWGHFKDVNKFAISLEPINVPKPVTPSEIVLQGQLVAL